MSTRKLIVAWVVIGTCVIGGGVSLSQQKPPDQPSPAARSVLENMEITPEGGVNFYTTFKGKRMRSLAISPQGSLIAGGVSYGPKTPVTSDPPTLNPVDYDKAGAHGGRDWVHDFYFGRFMPGEGQPRLYTRGLFLWGRGDSPDIQLGRTGPDNSKTMYGPQEDTSPGTSLGKICFVNWGEGEFQGDLATITARNDSVATKTKNPGSLHFHTAGPTTFTDPKKVARAWRDGPERMVIRSNGYVGIGDEPSPAERLHVFGNIRAEGNIVAKGTKKFEIDHPTRPGKKLVHAAIEGPEAAVFYRGEGQLHDGRALIALPEYFEALTAPQGRTITLTNLDGFDRLAVQSQAGVAIKAGQFVVASEDSRSAQKFFWEVKAVRADVGPLEAEPQ